jgi:AmmeMemoRadiSam system protein B/AmmeMemoRadiSam system protein A
MKISINIAAFMAVFMLSALCTGNGPAPRANAKGGVNVRKPAAAGRFYPSDPERLALAIDGFLDDAIAPAPERPIAIVCPHAGYIYSGQVAADAYKQASKHSYDVVVILGVNHTVAGFDGASVYPSGGFETPLGIAGIDEALAARLISADKRFAFDGSVHQSEHSVEVQVPFIQRVFPGVKILPVVVSAEDPALCRKLGESLAAVLQGRKPLIVASSDLSHYPEYEDAERVDRTTLEAISSLDPESFRSVTSRQMSDGVPELGTCACGEAPILTAMTAAKLLGATSGRIISSANSGDTSIGTHSRVVGYGAVAFVGPSTKSHGAPAASPPGHLEESDQGEDDDTITNTQRNALLSFARETIRRYLTTETTPLARGFDPALANDKGAFVTLRKRGELRGCIGHMAQDMPLCQVVGYCALQAAFNDRRFAPVENDELDEIEIEISVLTPYRRVDGYDDIEIGRDGVLMEKDGRSAVFLPSVAVEQGWSRDEMLSHLSAKAGLAPDAWKKNAEFYTFRAIAFSESGAH